MKKYNYEEAYNITQKYRVLYRFKGEYNDLHNWICKNGLSQELYSHMDRTEWTIESAQKEISKFNNRDECIKNCRSIFNWASFTNNRIEVLSILDKVRPGKKSKWTLEKVKIEAMKYGRSIDFVKGSPSAYRWAVRQKLTKELQYNPSIKTKSSRFQWNLEKVIEEASKYEYCRDFYYSSRGAYSWASKRGLIKEITKDMKRKPHKYNNTTLETVSREVKEFKTRKSLKKHRPDSYHWLIKNKLLEELLPSSAEEWNIEKIMKEIEGMSTFLELKKKSPCAYRWLCRNNKLKIVSNRFYDLRYQKVKKEALKYKQRIEFYKESNSEYQWAHRNNLLDEFCDHMK
jgi:hypothetical protein